MAEQNYKHLTKIKYLTYLDYSRLMPDPNYSVQGTSLLI